MLKCQSLDTVSAKKLYDKERTPTNRYQSYHSSSTLRRSDLVLKQSNNGSRRMQNNSTQDRLTLGGSNPSLPHRPT